MDVVAGMYSRSKHIHSIRRNDGVFFFFIVLLLSSTYELLLYIGESIEEKEREREIASFLCRHVPTPALALRRRQMAKATTSEIYSSK